MHDQTTRVGQDDDADMAIMFTLLNDQDQRPWAVDELIREVGDRVRAVDAIGRLHRGGLIHRTGDDLVFPTRAALYMDRISASRPAAPAPRRSFRARRMPSRHRSTMRGPKDRL